MDRIKLNSLNISTLPPGEYPDQIVPGLQLTVGARRRSWSVRYRQGGKQFKPVIGYHIPNAPKESDSMGIAAARDKARELLGRIESGVPAEERVAPVHPKNSKSLGDLIDAYETMKRRQGGRIKRLDDGLRTVRNGLKAYLSLPAKQFSKADLRAARDKIAKRGAVHQSSLLLRNVGPILRWASAEDHIEHDFSREVLKVVAPAKRERTLTHGELKAIWTASFQLEKEGGVGSTSFGRLVRFLLLTAQRKDEGLSLKFGDILDKRWKMTQNKSDRMHIVPLPQMAMDIVGEGAAGDLVFPGRSKGKLQGISKLKSRLDTLSGATDWRLHDLRRTAASEMQELGIAPHGIEAVLNHAMPGVGAIYLRAQLEQMKGEALAEWAIKLQKVVGSNPIAAIKEQ
ncbi:integrase [Rhizobium sp. BK181]|uniref:tyrosine-type recombinase/integrase n=1 Tax=Rhizobium sp. BK181 TaxID=2587072 RepID=UPI00162298CF|nr:integrase family protein [Rhizobium sp. BK181]MBB3318944.1 integrase [Rhizobium sp. BK181]